MASQVEQICQQLEHAPQSERLQKTPSLLDLILQSSNDRDVLAGLQTFASVVTSDALGIVSARPLLHLLVDRLRAIPSLSLRIEVCQSLLATLHHKVVSFEEQDRAIREILADAHEDEEDFRNSARVLQSISLDSSQRSFTADERAKIWVRIVRCYLEEEDPISATGYLNRVKNIIFDVTDATTKLQYELSRARILDSQRSFLEASSAYHILSLQREVDEDERLQALSASITCAVLAPAGPQRAKMLARLYKDERATHVEEYSILERIFLDRLLSPTDIAAFEKKLSEHQLAKTSDGFTVLQKAVLEHNMVAASRLYNNIRVEELGGLLGIDKEKAERYAAQMIEEGRLAGYIDQVDGLIYFEGESTGERGVVRGDLLVGREMRTWDGNLRGQAEEVERITTMIQNQYPEFYASQMVH
ncbi:hypothetical protein P152DRAFT_414657 [Eremomyces bilateralis CBS 781.70]|uniref:COP9 signalosome complex subunit 4 n=1 Tax=Eremomyces bilateralis CBS 781.70 TaxID=1392243 RepID=A0A6G1G7H8_9PEZI|nr:uncharacterized protein P152DRAFT_414657 [Eremomyces bilateralis CBS 781.70]KAF1814045.1 hypothetical protein P152DRAFT_414657 [Eremomyces bilateralis CBS 781.70]